MKTLIPIIPIVAAWALFDGTVLRGEEAVGPNSPDLPRVMQRVAASAQQGLMDADKQYEEALQQFELLTDQFDAAANQYGRWLQAVPPNPPVPPREPGEPSGFTFQRGLNRRMSGGPEKA